MECIRHLADDKTRYCCRGNQCPHPGHPYYPVMYDGIKQFIGRAYNYWWQKSSTLYFHKKKKKIETIMLGKDVLLQTK
jgi:hypothetical protein